MLGRSLAVRAPSNGDLCPHSPIANVPLVSIVLRLLEISVDFAVIVVTWLQMYRPVKDATMMGVRISTSAVILADGESTPYRMTGREPNVGLLRKPLFHVSVDAFLS